MDTVGRVDVHENRANLGRRVLRHNPLGVIGRPDAKSFACVDPQCHQSAGEAIDLGLELAIGVAQILVAADQCFAVLLTLRDAVEHIANRGADQRDVGCTVSVRQLSVIGEEWPRHVLAPLNAPRLRAG